MAGPGTKIKDGLFLGCREAVEETHIAVEAKVSRVINCCGDQLPNTWQSLGVTYLNYKWQNTASQIILDEADNVANETFAFIEEAAEKGESVLVHSFNGDSRSCVIVSAYMMKKYSWTLRLATEFLKHRKVTPKIKPAFLQQLLNYERRLAAARGCPLCASWDGAPSEELDSDEGTMLRNTYFNVMFAAVEDRTKSEIVQSVREVQKISWADGGANDPDLLEDVSDGEHEPCDRLTKPGKSILKSSHGEANGKQTSTQQSRIDNNVKQNSMEESGVDNSKRSGFDDSSIKIRTRMGIVHCWPEDIVHKRLGLKFECNTILLEYCVPKQDLRAFHTVNVNFEHCCSGISHTDVCDEAVAAHLQSLHAPWLAAVSIQQLEQLVGRLRTASCKK